MNFAAKLAMVSFKNQEEMLSFKGDFQAALAFIEKLDEVDVSEATLLFSNHFLPLAEQGGRATGQRARILRRQRQQDEEL